MMITGKNKLVFLSTLAFLLSFFCMPLNAEKKKREITMKKSEDFNRVYFPKIKNYDVELDCVSYLRSFKAGDDVKLTFRLTNFDIKPLVIYEWFAKEANNIRLYYIPWHKGMKKPEASEWIPIIPDVGSKPERSSLELKYKNNVLIDVPLPFIKELKPERDVRHYIIYAELNLNSISAKSKYIKITIKPDFSK